MPELSERDRRDRIRSKITEVSILMTRLTELLGDFNALGVDAAFKYTPGADGCSGDLEFMYSIQDKVVHVDDAGKVEAEVRAMLDAAAGAVH